MAAAPRCSAGFTSQNVLMPRAAPHPKLTHRRATESQVLWVEGGGREVRVPTTKALTASAPWWLQQCLPTLSSPRVTWRRPLGVLTQQVWCRNQRLRFSIFLPTDADVSPLEPSQRRKILGTAVPKVHVPSSVARVGAPEVSALHMLSNFKIRQDKPRQRWSP